MMNDSPKSEQADRAWGLCATCRHRRLVVSDKGARFVFCELSKRDARFPKYPRLPMVRCEGFDRAEAS
jgi:hypothetical protein